MGDLGYGIDPAVATFIARQIEGVVGRGVQVAVVVGGGNIVRGLEASAQGVDRVTGDYMGMLATMINALALRDALERRGLQCRGNLAFSLPPMLLPSLPPPPPPPPAHHHV